MEPSLHTAELRDRLHPFPYTDLIPAPPPGVELLLTCQKHWLARYALAIAPWDNSLDGKTFLKSRRKWVADALGACSVFREVGLYLVIPGLESEWNQHISHMPADKTGLHAVIVQAVHFVDPWSGATSINQSAWGPVKFGGVDSVAQVVNSILPSTS